MEKFIKDYFSEITPLINGDPSLVPNLMELKALMERCNEDGGTTFLLGNGASAAIASHVAVDLTKNARIKAQTFNEYDLLTCFANDFGYENWMAKSLEFYAKQGDLVVLISSSGNSKNIRVAANWCIENNINLVCFSGMSEDNYLNSLDEAKLKFWVNSRAYNYVETIHQLWLLCVVDSIIGRKEYSS